MKYCPEKSSLLQQIDCKIVSWVRFGDSFSSSSV